MTRIVAYQGEPGSFSEEAARTYFGRGVRLHPCANFRDVFRFAASGRNHAGVVPIENTVFGSIHQTYDLLLSHHLQIAGELRLRIRMNLMALPGTRLADVRRVYSQLQAIGQCEAFLGRMNNVEVHPFHDTAAAARFLREKNVRDAAAIASESAARLNRLKILKRSIETDRQNYTRFIVLERKSVGTLRHPKTSIVFAMRDVPGALFKALAVFALRDVNLLKIESRPLVGKPWEYLFYLDVDGVPDRFPLSEALNHLRELSIFVRVLGTYERAPGRSRTR